MGFFKSIKLIASLLETVAPERNVHERDGWERTPLLCATDHGDLQAVQWLVNNTNADINAKTNDGETALHCAAEQGCLDIVKWLVEEKGWDVNARANDGETALNCAAEAGRLDIVKWLVEETTINVDVIDNEGRTYLMSRRQRRFPATYLLRTV